jgi:hypothetical protein
LWVHRLLSARGVGGEEEKKNNQRDFIAGRKR